MEDRLRNLKSTLNESVLKELKFSKNNRIAVMNRINMKKNPKLDILQLLQVKRTGYEISRSLFSRGIYRYQFDEGNLYLLLHELEMSQYIAGEWINEEKYYVLTNKGLKFLHQIEKQSERPHFHNSLVEGDC